MLKLYAPKHWHTDAIKILLRLKEVSYETTDENPTTHKGPVLFSNDFPPIYGTLVLLDFIDDRYPIRPMYSPDPTKKALVRHLVDTLLNEAVPQHNINEMLDGRTPYVLPELSMLDVVLAAYTGDKDYGRDLLAT